LKKIFAAMFALMLMVGHVEAADFTPAQVDKIFELTVNNPAVAADAALPFDAATFQQNYNAFMMNFIVDVGTSEEISVLQKIFLLNGATVTLHDEGTVFTKNFLNRAAIVGLSDSNGRLKVLNLFAVQVEGRDDALFHALILQAFIRAVTPDFDSTSLLRAVKKNPAAPVVHNGISYTITRDENLNIVTAVAE